MRAPALRLPWSVVLPALVVTAGALGIAMNYFVGPYFERSFLDEPDPLAGVSLSEDDPAGTPSATPVDATPDDRAEATPGPQPVVLAQGQFRDGEPGHFGRGTARIGRDGAGLLFLVFEDFSVTNGPDLHVILSEDPDGSGSGLNLGKLKATDGNFSYDIPEGTDVARFQSVTIWCKSFPTIFAVARLER